MFKRKGADLYINKDISLFEALSGIKFDLIHLDGRSVQISTQAGKILGNGETMCVEDLGMPFFGRSYKYGNMFVVFTVVFPESLTKSQIATIRECLHTKEQGSVRYDPTIKPEHKLKMYQGTEQELLAKLRKRCN